MQVDGPSPELGLVMALIFVLMIIWRLLLP